MKNTRTLILPGGGTMEIPLPGSNARFEMNPSAPLSFADGSSRLPTVLVGVMIGAGLGIGVTVWYLRSQRR